MTSETDLRLGGFVPLSAVDWQDSLTATVFTRGCPWDCPYCHNAHLRSPDVTPPGETGERPAAWDGMRPFLRSRLGLLDGVIFSGGEPTMQPGLAAAMAEVRAMGLHVGLHTGGPDPERLARVLGLADWVGFDAKAPFDRYETVTRVNGSGAGALESLRRTLASGAEVEVRTTIHPDLLPLPELARLGVQLKEEGVGRWVLQRYRSVGVRRPLREAALPDEAILPALAEGPAIIRFR